MDNLETYVKGHAKTVIVLMAALVIILVLLLVLNFSLSVNFRKVEKMGDMLALQSGGDQFDVTEPYMGYYEPAKDKKGRKKKNHGPVRKPAPGRKRRSQGKPEFPVDPVRMQARDQRRKKMYRVGRIKVHEDTCGDAESREGRAEDYAWAWMNDQSAMPTGGEDEEDTNESYTNPWLNVETARDPYVESYDPYVESLQNDANDGTIRQDDIVYPTGVIAGELTSAMAGY
jgi:hypothetical protein